MERREFLAAMGTAAAVSSASQVFAQTGGGSLQKLNVAVYVALEAKPGKEEAVAEFLRQGKALAEAGAFVSDAQPSPFSTLFPRKLAGKPICPGKSPPR